MSFDLENIVQQCKLQQPEAQQRLYDIYKGKLYAICLRYIKDTAEAEDVFIEGFYKIFNKIADFKEIGSFEGWMRRIMVNESLMYLRKNQLKHQIVPIPDTDIADEIVLSEDDNSLEFNEIMAVMDRLPVGYRTVFNLYVFEDMKHREIAEHLGISINTSKSQYLLAKKKILELLEMNKIKS